MQEVIDFYGLQGSGNRLLSRFNNTSIFNLILRSPLQTIFFGTAEEGLTLGQKLLCENSFVKIDSNLANEEELFEMTLTKKKYLIDVTQNIQIICSKNPDQDYEASIAKAYLFYLCELAIRGELSVQIFCNRSSFNQNLLPSEISSRLMSLNGTMLCLPSIDDVKIFIKNSGLEELYNPSSCPRSYQWMLDIAT
jgi:hypothetical protein